MGLVLAVASITMAEITGNALWDAYGTIAIGVLLGAIAIVLIVEMRSLLLGESASKADIARISSAVSGHPSVRRLIHMRTMHLGPEELLVAVKIDLDPTLSFVEVAAIIDEAEALVRAAVPSALRIYLEPAMYDPARPIG